MRLPLVTAHHVALANVLAWLHPTEQPIDHLFRALLAAQIAEIDARDFALRENDVEPDHLSGLQVDESGIIELARAADVRSAEANEAPGNAKHAKRNATRRGDLVFRMSSSPPSTAARTP